MSFHKGIIVVIALLPSCGPKGFDSGSDFKPSTRTDTGDVVPPAAETSLDLTTCGYDVEKPASLAISRRLTMEPVKKTIKGILGDILGLPPTEVTFNGTMVIEGSLTGYVLSSGTTATPNLTNSVEVTDTLKNLRSGADAKLLDVGTRARIGEVHPAWAGLYCVLQPATQFVSNIDKRIVLDFSQPIPYGVLTLADLERIKSELRSKRSFTKVTAEVVSSDDPSIVAGSKIEGTITAGLVPVASIPGAVGDVAVSITYDFGGPESTVKLGLPTSMVWIINTTEKTLGSVQLTSQTEGALLFK
jgi:hypothetical protein